MFDYYADTITEYLQEFLDRNELDCGVALGTDFSYIYPRSLVTYTLVVTDIQQDSFLKFAESLFPEIRADIFLWSFLHEVGHHETLDDFEDIYHQAYHQLINSGIELSDEYYYNLPIEKAATEWAGEFMKNNVSEVQRLWNNIQPVLKRLYTEI